MLVQSEVHVQTRAIDAASATDVDARRANADGRPDHVVFNGVANGCDTTMLTVKVGERVRVWFLDIGPNPPASFHIVGAQFDTVFLEGGYLLKRGQDTFGDRDGGHRPSLCGLHKADSWRRVPRARTLPVRLTRHGRRRTRRPRLHPRGAVTHRPNRRHQQGPAISAPDGG